MIRALLLTLVAGSSLVGLPLGAQGQPSAPAVTLEQIMADPDWLGIAPEMGFWSADSTTVYFERKRPGAELRDLYRQRLAAGDVERVPDAERSLVDAPDGSWSRDRQRKAYVLRGDVFVRELTTGVVRQLTRTADAEREPLMLADGHRVAFRREDVWFVRDLTTGVESQPADLRLTEDPDKAPPDPPYLTAQQLRLFQILQKNKARKEAQAARERELGQADAAWAPRPFYLGKGQEIADSTLSPSGNHLLVALVPEKPDAGKADAMPNYVTASGYVESREVRPKVGTGKLEGQKLVLLDLMGHQQWVLELGEGGEEKGKKDNKDKKSEKGEKGEKGEEKKDRRAVEVLEAVWSPGGERLALMVRAADNKDRWVVTVDLATGKVEPRERLTDPAWISWDLNELGFSADGQVLWVVSEESGYARIYRHHLATGARQALTPDGSLARDVVLSAEGQFLYYRGNPEFPGVFEVYRVALAGGSPPEKITSLGGMNDFVLSPDDRQLLVRHSKALMPPELYVQEATPGAAARQLTDTVSAAFRAVPWAVPEFVPVPSTHGAPRPVYSRVYVPPGFDPTRAEKYPAVIFVHGAGYLQNAHQGWSSYFREFMFHTLLTQHGYVVIDMDFRGSAGYGRAWRTAIYRHMGQPELEDLLDGITWLAANRNVDPERVGVYGGSYGGFMTLMALLKKPGTFAAGAALRPVTDWAHYNHEYTSNILNTPGADKEAYERSSPIELAANLEDPLLLIHGMQDDNVFFQDTVRFAQRLIELEKQDWEVAMYPIEPHGFREPSSWLDAYRRIFKLFEREVRGAR